MTSELLSAHWCQGHRALVLRGATAHRSESEAFSNMEVVFSLRRGKHNQSWPSHIASGHYAGPKEGDNKSGVPRDAFSKRRQ